MRLGGGIELAAGGSAASAHGDRQTFCPGEGHSSLDSFDEDAASNQGWATIDHALPDLTGGVVLGVQLVEGDAVDDVNQPRNGKREWGGRSNGSFHGNLRRQMQIGWDPIYRTPGQVDWQEGDLLGAGLMLELLSRVTVPMLPTHSPFFVQFKGAGDHEIPL